MDVVKRIEAVKTNGRDAPVKEVIIADSGSISVDVPFTVPK
jgi:peptidyl-prolyl cis-trans isomerase B (cyclophilin B)